MMMVFDNMDSRSEQGSFFSRKSATASASVTISPFLAPPPETRNRKSSGQGGQKFSAFVNAPGIYRLASLAQLDQIQQRTEKGVKIDLQK